MNSCYRVNTMKILHAFYRWIVSILAILAAVLALSGCLSKPPLHKQTFTFGAPPTASGGAIAGNRVLGIRSLRIAPPFDGRSLVYRTGEFSYVRDPYAEFLEPARGRNDGARARMVESSRRLQRGSERRQRPQA